MSRRQTGAGGGEECSEGPVCWGRQKEEEVGGMGKNLVGLHSGFYLVLLSRSSEMERKKK